MLVGRYLCRSTRAMAEGMREGSVRLLLEWQQRWRRGAASDSSRTDTGLAGTAVLHEYAPLHCSGP